MTGEQHVGTGAVEPDERTAEAISRLRRFSLPGAEAGSDAMFVRLGLAENELRAASDRYQRAVAETEWLKIENALLKEALTVHGLPWVARSVERRMADRLAAERGQ